MKVRIQVIFLTISKYYNFSNNFLFKPMIGFSNFQNYEATIEDLNKVLLIDSSIGEAQKELDEATQLFKLRCEFTANNQPKQRKKIEIQEVFKKNHRGLKALD